MSAEIREVVQIDISRETQAVQQAGFGVLMFLDLHQRFNERIRTYTTAAAMLSDGFSSADAAYLAASAYFGQSPAPTSIKIGRRDASVTTLNIAAATTAAEEYDVNLFAVGFTDTQVNAVSVTGSETNIQMAAIVHAAINAGTGTHGVISTDNTDGTLTLTSTGSVDFSVTKETTNITLDLTTAETLTAALTAVNDADRDWYGLATYTHDGDSIEVASGAFASDIEEVAAYAEANKRIYGYATANADDKTTAQTGIGAVLQAKALDRTFGLWSGNAGVGAADATEYGEAAWFGDRFPSDPGSSTWAFKTLSGITVDNLTSTESQNAATNGLNTYERIGGVNVTRDGIMASGEYIDIMRGVDWLEARMSERIYSRLVNLPKIPYTDAGIAIIEAEIRAQLQEGVAAGLLTDEVPFVITVPKAAEVAANDKANRLLQDIEFEATLAGAVHKVVVQGRVVL